MAPARGSGNLGLLRTRIDEFLFDAFTGLPVDLAANEFDQNGPESLYFADGGVLNGTGGFRPTGEYNMRQPQTFGVSLDYAF